MGRKGAIYNSLQHYSPAPRPAYIHLRFMETRSRASTSHWNIRKTPGLLEREGSGTSDARLRACSSAELDSL